MSTTTSRSRASGRTRRWPHRLVAVTLVLSGGGVMGWPVGETFVNNYSASEDTTAYVQEVHQVPAQELRDELAQAREYNDSLAPSALHDPWGPTGDQSLAGDEAYTSQLSRFGAFARIRIPQIAVDLPVYHGTTKSVLDKGAGHMFGTDLPVGGPGTHAVIAAHTGMRARTYFDRLPEMAKGQTFQVDIYGETLTYQVDQILVVEPWELDAIAPVAGQDYLTLVTCYTPPHEHQQRLLVRGHRIPNPPPAQGTESGAQAGVPGAESGVPAVNSDRGDAPRATDTAGDSAPVTVDTSIQQWMWPRIAAVGGAIALVAVMGIGWSVSDRRAAKRARRAARAAAAAPNPEPTTEPVPTEVFR